MTQLETPLTLTLSDLKARVGYHLGFGRDSTAWSTDAGDQIEEVVQDGYRQFLYPPPIMGEATAHQWSFLHPVYTLVTVQGRQDYDLPADFGGFQGDLTYDSDDFGLTSIVNVGPETILNLRQLPYNETGGTLFYRPQKYGLRPKHNDGTSPVRWELLLWPSPDAGYTLSATYHAYTGRLDADHPWPIGGMPHTETLLQSIRAVAEQRMFDAGRGPEWAKYMELLAASVAHDRTRFSTKRYGYVGDKGDEYRPIYRTRHVTYGGVLYTGE